jgi:hypothetical protein
MCNPLPNPSNKAIAAVALVLDLFWPGVGMMIVGFADDSRSNPGIFFFFNNIAYPVWGIVWIICAIICICLFWLVIPIWIFYFGHIIMWIICLVNNIQIISQQ